MFLSDPIWFENYFDIDCVRVRDKNSREFRNVKWIILELCLFWIFACFLIADIFLFTQTRPSSRLVEMHSSFWNFPANASNSSDFWDWASQDLAPKVFGSDFSSAPLVSVVDSPSVHVVAGTDMILMGSVRFRQLRVPNTVCSNAFNYYQISAMCSGDFSSSNSDMTSFSNSGVSDYLSGAFVYSSNLLGREFRSDLSGFEYISDGGFVYDYLGESSALGDLQAAGWIDSHTSAILVEVNTYHANSDAFAVDYFTFEFGSANLVQSRSEAFIFPSSTVYASWYNASFQTLFFIDFFVIFFFTICLIFWVYQVYCVSIPRLFGWWFCVELGIICCVILLIIYRSLIYVQMSSNIAVNGGMADASIFYSLSSLINLQSSVTSIQAVLFCGLVVRGLKGLYVISPEFLIGVKRTFAKITGVAVGLGLCLIGFALAYHVQLGHSDPDYDALSNAFSSVGLSLISVVNFKSTEWIENQFVSGISVLWVGWVYCILIPLCIAFVIVDHSPGDRPTCTCPISECLRVWRGGSIPVETPDEPEVEMDSLPQVVQRKIRNRRFTLRSKMESIFGVSPNAYDENCDYISTSELGKLMKEDQNVSEILGAATPEEVLAIQKRGSTVEAELRKKIHVAEKKGIEFGTEMDPEIKEISTDLIKRIDETRVKAERDIAPLIVSVNNLYQTVHTISTKLHNSIRRSSAAGSL